MNLILFEPHETAATLPRSDPRTRHLLDVLRRHAGDGFDAGIINGPRGRGLVEKISPAGLTLSFVWGAPPPPPDPIALLIGLPRPQTARKILGETAALGAAALHFFSAEKGESGYAQSTLWSDGEWRRHLIAGAEQAFDTRLPRVSHGLTLAAALAETPPGAVRLALDNYEAPRSLGESLRSHDLSGAASTPTISARTTTTGCQLTVDISFVLAFGPERGWSPAERNFLRTQHFSLVHLGPRVLRTGTAVVAALALVRSRLGLM